MRVPDFEFNRLAVLRKLRANEPVARTELAALSGLTGGTITGIVRDLVDRGLVLEERVPSPGRGRPRINLRINPRGAFVAGGMLTQSGRIRVKIVDLKGHIVHAHAEPVVQPASLADLAGQFSAVLLRAIEASPLSPDELTHVGLGLPAIVDNQRGTIESLALYGERSFPFAAQVERAIGLPVRIDNNVNLLARAEYWFGETGASEDFLLVLVDLAVGAARYRGGQLMTGSRGSESELGHTKIVPDGGLPCVCGAQGCLQAYSSLSGLAQQASALWGEPAPGHAAMPGVLERALERARQGEEDALALFRRAGRYLGTSLANQVNMQDPDGILVVVAGDEVAGLIGEPLAQALERDTLPVLRGRNRLRFARYDERRFALGAAAMVLEELYQSR